MFLHTRPALESLKKLLRCRKCSGCVEEIFTPGQCEHHFCRGCADGFRGNACPVCSMPCRANNVQIDRQLSNIAALCTRMTNILEGKDDAELTKIPKTQSRKGNDDKGRGNKHQNLVKDVTAELKGGAQLTETNKKRRKSATSSVSSREPKTMTAEKRKRNLSKTKEENNENITGHSDDSVKDTKLGTPLRQTSNKPVLLSGSNAKKKSHIMKRNAKGETPLQVSTIKMDLEAVKRLLQEGANPNVKDNAGWTPLHEAVNHGDLRITELLLNYGAAVNVPGLDNDTPLHDAVSNGRVDCIRLLVTRGADTLARNIHGKTPLDLSPTDEITEVLLTGPGTQHVPDALDMSSTMDQSQPICLMGSALSKEQNALLQECAKVLDAKVVDGHSSEATHLITGVNAKGACPRTLKYLHAILAGSWIVTPEWLQSCLKSNEKVAEEPFEVKGCSSNQDPRTSQKARQNLLKQLPGLFDGCQFFFFGKFEFPTPSREELINLVKRGGGTILTREPRLHNLDDYPYTIPYHASASSSLADCAVFVIYDDACRKPPHVNAQRMSYLPASWLMDSIATFSLLEKTMYLQQ